MRKNWTKNKWLPILGLLLLLSIYQAQTQTTHTPLFTYCAVGGGNRAAVVRQDWALKTPLLWSLCSTQNISQVSYNAANNCYNPAQAITVTVNTCYSIVQPILFKHL